MADLFNIMKITVSADKLCARVLVNPGMPLRTSENIEATARVYYLVPAIAEHACLGDAGERFQDCMRDTELAHLLEHLTVEIMRQTDLAGDVVAGRTRQVPEDERLFDIELTCPDDALTAGALSSAAFMMQWAYRTPEAPAPDFAGTVAALRQLVLGLRAEAESKAEAPASASEDAAPGDERFIHRPPQFIDTEGAVVSESAPSRDALFGGAAGDAQAAQAGMPGLAADAGATVQMPALSD